MRAGRGRDRTAHALDPRSPRPPAPPGPPLPPARVDGYPPAVPAGTRVCSMRYGTCNNMQVDARRSLAGTDTQGQIPSSNDRVSSQCSALRWCSLVLRVRFSLDAGPCAGRGVAQNISATRPLPGPSRSGRRGAADAHRHHPGEASPLHSCLERLRSVPASCHNLRSHFLQTREASGSTRLPTLALLTLLALLLDA